MNRATTRCTGVPATGIDRSRFALFSVGSEILVHRLRGFRSSAPRFWLPAPRFRVSASRFWLEGSRWLDLGSMVSSPPVEGLRGESGGRISAGEARALRRNEPDHRPEQTKSTAYGIETIDPRNQNLRPEETEPSTRHSKPRSGQSGSSRRLAGCSGGTNASTDHTPSICASLSASICASFRVRMNRATPRVRPLRRTARTEW